MYINVDSSKFDYETQEDAQALMRLNAIKADPKRMKKAKECVAYVRDTLAGKTPKDSIKPCKSSNPATVGKLTLK